MRTFFSFVSFADMHLASRLTGLSFSDICTMPYTIPVRALFHHHQPRLLAVGVFPLHHSLLGKLTGQSHIHQSWSGNNKARFCGPASCQVLGANQPSFPCCAASCIKGELARISPSQFIFRLLLQQPTPQRHSTFVNPRQPNSTLSTSQLFPNPPKNSLKMTGGKSGGKASGSKNAQSYVFSSSKQFLDASSILSAFSMTSCFIF